MPVMFPGMNPYLEHPDLWPIIHPQFVAALANLLEQTLSNRYRVIIRKRIYRVSGEDSLIVGQPAQNAWGAGTVAHDGVVSQQPIPIYVAVPQTVQEDYIEIVDHHIGATVTIVETLTPQKKRPGRGRDNYEQRCEAILGGDTHFVEIDLLRSWEPISAYGPSHMDYRILVSRSEQRPQAELYTWQVDTPIPPLTIPIGRPQDGEGIQADCMVNLKQALDDACIRLNSDAVINYERDPIPPLEPAASQWLDTLLGQVGLRQSRPITNRYDEERLKTRSAHL